MTRNSMDSRWADEELVPLAALEHYAYCPRQCALIHVEQTYEENVFTLRGNRLHERVDIPGFETLDEARHERGMPLWSERLGVVGKADVVAFSEDGTPYPIEFKAGKRGKKRSNELQLCGQALCLEEMTGMSVARGAVFYHSSRRRQEVILGAELRRSTELAIEAVREMFVHMRVPPPVADKRCDNCSLIESCMPFGIMRARDRISDSLYD